MWTAERKDTAAERKVKTTTPLTSFTLQTFIQNLLCEVESGTQRETSCSPYPQGGLYSLAGQDNYR